MTFLAASWLWALTALAIPIAIHLLSRAPAKRVRVGSVALMAGSTSRRARRLRPSDPWLLLLRLLLLAAVILALAGPRWPTVAGAATTWSLVDPGLIAERAELEATDPALFSRLDALAAAGSLRWLDADLPMAASAAESGSSDLAIDLWSLLREADARVPPGSRLEVFARDRLVHLRGERPALGSTVVWHALAAPEPERSITRPLPRPEPSPLAVSLRYDPERALDVEHLAAALGAIAREGRVALAVDRTETIDTGAIDTAEILIWLADAPVPDTWQRRIEAGTTLLRDGTGPFAPCAGTVFLAGGSFELHRCLPGVEKNAAGSGRAVRWRDGRGRPLLTVEREGKGSIWRFHNRFHPRWSTLVTSPIFPRWLAGWLAGEARRRGKIRAAPAVDRRSAGVEQLRVRDRAEIDAPESSAGSSAAPEYGLWALAALILAFERGVAARRER